MEFIQKKTADNAVEHFLPIAADKGVKLAWDRFEGQLPECGFCESGLSCRDCLQGPCISHPFRDVNKLGVCGKDKDIMAVQTLLKLVIKGTMASLDQVSDFVEGVASGAVKPKDAAEAGKMIAGIEALLKDGSGLQKAFPKALLAAWEEAGIYPRVWPRTFSRPPRRLRAASPVSRRRCSGPSRPHCSAPSPRSSRAG
jgi:hypothetical protein